MLYFNLTGFVLSVAAIIISLLTYLLSRKMANENKIFEEKIRCYHTLIKAINDTVGIIFTGINDYRILKMDKSPNLQDEKDEINDEIDDAVFALEDIIAENCLLIPDKILELLYASLDLLDKDEYLETYRSEKKMEKFEDDINEQFDAVVVAMQVDLHFKKLDHGLKRRTGGYKSQKTENEQD
jgi:hypothetical protein